MIPSSLAIDRPITLTREGSLLRLAFAWNSDLVEKAKSLPFATFDGDSKTWTTEICTASVDSLRTWFLDEGLTDVSVDSLLDQDETIPEVAAALLTEGSVRRPYLVRMAFRNDNLFAKLKSIPGATWERNIHGFSYDALATVALSELVQRKVLADPHKLLSPADVVISFDGRNGRFLVQGNPKAHAAFVRKFPSVDVYGVWKMRNIDVEFDSLLTKEIYYGELARVSEGIQPEGLLLPLYPHQAREVALASERSGIGIFDGPGIGKTASAIATAQELMNNRHVVPRTVFVVPGAVRTHWAREIRRFTGNEDIVIIQGDLKSRQNAYREAENARWLIVHYDIIHRDIKMITPLVAGSLLVADEAHRLRNPTAKRTKSMRTLGAKAARRIALSGTPVENEPGEWYSILSGFTIPNIFGSPSDFFNRYQYPGRFGGYEGARNISELRQRSQPHFIRHTKAEVAQHLPPLRIQHMPLDPEPAYAAALNRAHRLAKEEIKQAALARRSPSSDEESEEVETGAAMTAVGMLRLMCSSPLLVAQSEAAAAQALRDNGLIPESDGPKVDAIREFAEELQATKERVVIFSFSKEMIKLVADRFKKDGIRYVVFTGDTSYKDREAAILAFTTPLNAENADTLPTAFLATDAAAEGLNLGVCCNTLVNLDIPWTPSRLEQRSNRIHRIDGTHSSYRVINYTVRGTIEEGILRHVEQKADLTDAIFGETGGRRRTTGRGGRSNIDKILLDFDPTKEN
jgi:superfamily II DNA or RNA helicase